MKREGIEFLERFEQNVKDQINEQKLFKKNDRIVVACSGGKDSTVILYLLHKFGYRVEALIIDLLMGEWSEKNLENIKKFCSQNKIKLHVVSIRDEMGYSICYIRSVVKPKVKLQSCGICGVIKKFVLNKKARELRADKIVTGHNMDDEAQTVLMNLFCGNLELGINMGPKSLGMKTKKFVQRVKPLYFVPERDIERYSRLMGFPVLYEKCPCSTGTLRRLVKNWLNRFEKKTPRAKENILKNFFQLQPILREFYKGENKMRYCSECKEPTRSDICKTCELMGKLVEN